MSKRNSQALRGAELHEHLLSAAAIQVMAFGVRRTTLTDVATRAGVSRTSVYRHFPDVTALLQALMWREFAAAFAEAGAASEEIPATRQGVIARAIGGLQALCEHPLFLRIVELEPELLLPYLTQRDGRFQEHVTDTLASSIEAAMAAGEVREGDPRRFARAMVSAMRGYAMASGAGMATDVRRMLIEDLALMMDGLLRPRDE